MMLDLNFGVTVSRSDSMEVEDFPAYSVAQMEDSGTSNSSIVNAEEALAPSYSGKDEDSSNNSSGFIFGIMRKQMESDGANWVDEANPSPELLTQLLFPDAANGKDWDLELRLGLATSATPQWLNLSFPDSGGGQTELKGFPQKQQLVRKSRRGPRSRSSQYRGVTFYRRTGRWESHIWDCGKQVYLGGFDTAHAAARAYDRAAIKFRGIDADINFNTGDYEEDIKQTKNLTKEEFVYILRRHSSGFARGSLKSQGPMFRKCGQWEGRVVGPMLGKNALSEFSNVKCGGSDIVSELGSMTSNNEINLDAIRGNGDNLDLSLGISRNKDGSIGNEKMGVINCRVNGDQKLNAERTKMDGCDASRVNGRQPRSGSVAMASQHPTSKFGSYPGFPPNQLDWIAEKRNEGVVVVSSSSSPPQRFANWAWQMSGSGKVSPVPVFSIAAASSGFSSFAPVAPPPAIPLNQPTTSTLQS